MNNPQIKQIKRIDNKSPISYIQAIDGVLYFTVDLGEKGKESWKNNGIKSIFVARI